MAESGHEKGDFEVSGRVEHILCQPCLNKDQQTAAEKFCSTCDEFQCIDCSKVHYIYAYLRGHKLVNANEAEPKQVLFDMKGLDQCTQHHKMIEFFCEDENQLCCSTCAIVDHRKCHSVVDIQKVVRMSSSNGSNLKVELQEVRQKADRIVQSVASSRGKLDEDVKEIQITIKRMRDEVNKMFDELESSVAKNVESFQRETVLKLTKKQLQNENNLAEITTYQETIDNVYQHGTSVQQFIAEQKMKNDVNVLHSNVDKECQGLETYTVSFDFDETLKLPPLSISEYVPGQLSLKSYLSEAASTSFNVNEGIKLTPVCVIDLKQSEDDKEMPFYRGIDFLPDGRLVAVDNENKKCLVYSKKLQQLGSYQSSYRPLSVVAVSEEEVMITSGEVFVCLRIDKSNEITLIRKFKVTTDYDSISLIDNEHFAVGTYDHSIPVRIISSTGKENNFNINFPNKNYSLGTSACTYIRDSDKLVLTDKCENTVYIYEIKTNTRIVIKDDRIKEPRAAAVGPYCTILVCSQNTHSIVQMSQFGRILSSCKMDMKFPRSICVSRDNKFLVVANKGENKIQKFKIEH